ncbi:hypothetical protein E2C01_040851 [Portunus trituberculatus]|uniref:Uncharacterized protein n=1 Tax=Portunus trituberculatus TaxID=210409 RepID=A0A5B7FNT0_PORTR|nr:hypothetical protein [Portunus trituberculatus]
MWPLHCTAATLPLHCRYTTAHCRYTTATLQLHYQYTAATLPPHCRYTGAHSPYLDQSLPPSLRIDDSRNRSVEMFTSLSSFATPRLIQTFHRGSDLLLVSALTPQPGASPDTNTRKRKTYTTSCQAYIYPSIVFAFSRRSRVFCSYSKPPPRRCATTSKGFR